MTTQERLSSALSLSASLFLSEPDTCGTAISEACNPVVRPDIMFQAVNI